MKPWRDEEGCLVEFLRELLVGDFALGPKVRIRRIWLWTRYEAWVEEEKVKGLGRREFYRAMEAKGFKSVKWDGHHCFRGIGLKK